MGDTERKRGGEEKKKEAREAETPGEMGWGSGRTQGRLAALAHRASHTPVLGAALPCVLSFCPEICNFQTRKQACEADMGALVGGKGFASAGSVHTLPRGH